MIKNINKHKYKSMNFILNLLSSYTNQCIQIYKLEYVYTVCILYFWNKAVIEILNIKFMLIYQKK